MMEFEFEFEDLGSAVVGRKRGRPPKPKPPGPRKICRDTEQILAMARRGEPLHRCEIHLMLREAVGHEAPSLANLASIEKRAIAKIEAGLKFALSDLNPPREPQRQRTRQQARRASECLI